MNNNLSLESQKAIDFAEWLLYRYAPVTTGITDNPYREIRKWYSHPEQNFYTTAELFEVYQKEKNEQEVNHRPV